ncbi:neprilysin-2-like isoform X2 [Stegodyphus dumicola]|uniref:neprilysin-2-like isoform X2 n=1 Tax=Stegodyphus dumicola TaxID=202533 RepID=UPI0015B14CCB|nr:neprilysin-2-like isoform X2 [Stegodyphus dumicola]
MQFLMKILMLSFFINSGNADLQAAIDRSLSLLNVSSDVCITHGCVKTAADILSSLDETVDPCDDFHQFACGGWLKTHLVSDKSDIFSLLQDVLNRKFLNLLEMELTGDEPDFIQKIKGMYETCMDLERINVTGSEPLKKALTDLGGWPVVEGENWNSTSFTWLDTLVRLRHMGFNHNILMNISVTQTGHIRRPTYIIKLDHPLLGTSRHFLMYELDHFFLESYFNLMVETANRLGANLSHINQSTLIEELKKVLSFEANLAIISLQSEQNWTRSSPCRRCTIKKLKDNFPQIDWIRFFTDLLNHEVTENEPLMINDLNLIIRLIDFITKADKRVVANYMLWRAVHESLPLMPKDWNPVLREHISAIPLHNARKARKRQCLSTISENLGVALSSYYVAQYFKEDSKKDVEEVIQYINTEFLNMLQNNEWMDNITKEKAIEKAEAITYNIGYPKELKNNSYISFLYTNVTLNNESYFDNMLNLRKWSMDNSFSLLRKTKPGNDYLNFGAIGSLIAHEITHGFFHKGRLFNKDGKVVSWWSDETNRRYNRKAVCITEQYNNFTAFNGSKVPSDNTVTESIADHGGLKAAYLAYKSWVGNHTQELKLPGLNYTPNQLFFISAARVLCEKKPNRVNSLSQAEFRIIGAMSNLPQFSSEFACSQNSTMNRRKKCQIW